jgi:hypothetical protein
MKTPALFATTALPDHTFLKDTVQLWLVEALHYKPEGRGFDFRCSHWNFSVT